jgi:hypothetical protein
MSSPAAKVQVADPWTSVWVSLAPSVHVGDPEMPEKEKVTLPAGVPVPGPTAWTRAVNVTDCPETAGLLGVDTWTLVLAGTTVTVAAEDEVLPEKSVSPE